MGIFSTLHQIRHICETLRKAFPWGSPLPLDLEAAADSQRQEEDTEVDINIEVEEDVEEDWALQVEKEKDFHKEEEEEKSDESEEESEVEEEVIEGWRSEVVATKEWQELKPRTVRADQVEQESREEGRKSDKERTREVREELRRLGPACGVRTVCAWEAKEEFEHSFKRDTIITEVRPCRINGEWLVGLLGGKEGHMKASLVVILDCCDKLN